MSQKIYMASVGLDSHIYMASATGSDWSISHNPIPISGSSNTFVTKMPVSVCAFGKKHYLAAVGTDGHVYLGSSSTGENLTISEHPLFPNYDGSGAFKTARPVAMTVFRRRLYMLLYGTDGKIYQASMNRDGAWAIDHSPLFPNFKSSSTWATVTVFRDTLYMAAVGSDSHIYLGSSSDGHVWTISSTPLFQHFNSQGAFLTKQPVSLEALGEVLCLAAVGENSNIYLAYSEDGKAWQIDSTSLFQHFNSKGSFQARSPVSLSAFEGTMYLAATGEDSNVFLGSSSNLRTWAISPTPLFPNFDSAGAFRSQMGVCLSARRVTVTPLEIDPNFVVQTRLMENFIEASPVRNLTKVKSACGSDGVFYVVASDTTGDVYQIVSSSSNEIPWTTRKITCAEPIIDFDVSGGSTPKVYILTASHAYSAPAGTDITIDQNTMALYTAPEGGKFLNLRLGETPSNVQQYAISLSAAGKYSIVSSLDGTAPSPAVQTDSPIIDFVCGADGTYNVFMVEFGPGQGTIEYVQENVPNSPTKSPGKYPDSIALCNAYESGNWLFFGVDADNNNLNLLNGSVSLGESGAAIGAAAMDGYTLVFSVGTGGLLSVAVGAGGSFLQSAGLGPLGGNFSSLPWQLSVCVAPGSTKAEAHLFAIGSTAGELYHIWQDVETYDWRMTPVVVPDEPELIQFASYATEIELVNDPDGAAMPLMNQEVTVSASDYLSASINGRSYVLGPNTSVPVFTDVRGMVTVTTQTRALSTPSLKVSALSMPPVTIQPEAYLQDALGNPKSAADLAKTLTNARTRVTNEPVVAAGADVADAAAGIYQCLSYLKPPPGNPDAINQYLSPRSQRAGVHFLAEDQWPDQIDLDSIPEQYWSLHFDKGQARFESLDAASAATSDCHQGKQPSKKWSWGTLWNSVRQEISTVTCMLVSKTEAGLKIVINIVSSGVKWALSYVIETVQQVWDVIEGIFAAIKTAFKTLFQWLGSIFDWNDILLTHQAMKVIATKFFQYLDEWSGHLKTEVDDFFENAQNVLTQDWAKVLGSNGSQTLPVMQVEATDDIDVSAAGPHQNWIMSALVNQAGNLADSSLPSLPSSWEGDAEKFCEQLNEAFDASRLTEKIGALATQTFEKDLSSLTLNDLALVIGDEVIAEAFSTLKGVVDSSLDYLNEGVNHFTNVVQQPVQIPVITNLYKSITQEQLTLLDLGCLIAAVPATSEYKILLGVKSLMTHQPTRPHGPFTQADIDALNELTPAQLFGPTPSDPTVQIQTPNEPTLTIQKRSPNPSPETLGRVEGLGLAVNTFLIVADGVLLALNDLVNVLFPRVEPESRAGLRPIFLILQQSVSLLSLGFTYPYSALIPVEKVRVAKRNLWAARFIFMAVNLMAMFGFKAKIKTVFPVLAFLEGGFILGDSFYIAHLEGGGVHYAAPANLQAYFSTILPLTGWFRSFVLVRAIDNAVAAPEIATGAFVVLEVIYALGTGVPAYINAAESARMILGLKPLV